MAVLNGVKLVSLDYTFIFVEQEKKMFEWNPGTASRHSLICTVSFSGGRYSGRPLSFPDGVTFFFPVQLWTYLTT